MSDPPKDEVDVAPDPVDTSWDLRHLSGPFDVIGDVHGCFDELAELLGALGYEVTVEREAVAPAVGGAPARVASVHVAAPKGRAVVFVGDLCDRGPQSPAMIRLAMEMIANRGALCVPGNHDDKLRRKLRGRNVRVAHGLGLTLEQIAREPDGFAREVIEFFAGLPSHVVLDEGRLVVAHAGLEVVSVPARRAYLATRRPPLDLRPLADGPSPREASGGGDAKDPGSDTRNGASNS
jgi:hypothetical protein